MTVAEPELREIVAQIFQSMLGVELAPSVDATLTDERTLTGCVQISGDWEGAVTIECGEALAREVAASMFGLHVDDIADDEVFDTIGELANMAGGNVKSRLAGSCHLSLPSVTSGRDYALSIRNSSVVECVAHTAGDRTVLASLLTRT